MRDVIKRLISRSRVARTVFVLLTWPFLYTADKFRGYDPAASLRVALAWARRAPND